MLEYFYVVVWKAELDQFSFDSGAMVALQHYHAVFRCPAGGQALFQFVSDLCQGPSSFWESLYDCYGFSPSAELYSYGELGLALVEFFQCAVESNPSLNPVTLDSLDHALVLFGYFQEPVQIVG